MPTKKQSVDAETAPVNIIPNMFVSISGDQKRGKTHFALTFPAPILLMSFDVGAKFVCEKHFPDKDVTIKEYNLPVVETTNAPITGVEQVWKDIQADFKDACESGKYKTVVIDTGTALWEIVRYAYKEETSKMKLPPLGYVEPNARFLALFQTARACGINFVITNHLKDEYANNEATGAKVLDGFKRTAGYADVCLTMARKGEKKDTRFVAKIDDCRFDPFITGEEIEMPDYDTLCAFLGV